MKELINIINSKLQSVIDELKSQKSILETKLKTVDVEIDKKVEAASICKSNVESSSNAISVLETDIEKLKRDLQDLHDKFDGAGFTELLEAGNKEINGKIIENNTKINEQQELIRHYSEEAQNIKDELTSLKDSKANLETELNNTIVVLKYYSKKIDDMTITAIEHAEKLSDIVIIDDDNNELVDVDVNKVIDGTIFDEIDNISSSGKELSEQEIEDILSAKEEVQEELSKTQALDAAIIQTDDEPVEVLETVPQEETKQEYIATTPQNIEEAIQTIAGNEEVVEDNKEEQSLTLNINTEEKEESTNNVQDIKSTFAEINGDVSDDLKDLDLDTSRFTQDNLNLLKGNVDIQKANKIIDVLDKHFIDIKNVYNNPQILITMAPEVLDEELDLLERAGCIASTIGYIFKYLDKIDINKLKSMDQGPTDSIIKVIYDCISEKESTNISEVLELNMEETKTLESNLDAKEYNIFCTFPEIIRANYDTIRNLHVENPVKCITEHPKRFINNPDVFDDILDKYDTPDLVRCINKNPAVIDKL